MIKIGTPHDSNYVIVENDDDLIIELHARGFIPEYVSGGRVYFRETEELLNVLEVVIND